MAVAVCREKYITSLFIRFIIKIPSLLKLTFYIKFRFCFRSKRSTPITHILPCCSKPREGIRSRERIPYGAGVIHSLYHHLIIGISPFIIRNPQIIILAVHLGLGVATSSNLHFNFFSSALRTAKPPLR